MAKTQLIEPACGQDLFGMGYRSGWTVRNHNPHLRLVAPVPHHETADMRRSPLLGIGISIGFSAVAWLGILLLVI